MDAARGAAGLQAGYYLPTAVLPFVSRRRFTAITGPKPEWWLVQTVSVLVGAIGAGLAAAALRRRVTPELGALAAGSAAGLTVIDLVYVARRRISPAYLLDAAAELLCVAAWVRAWRAREVEAPAAHP